MKIKVIKFENFYKMPERKHYNDAGADCYVPNEIIIPPHSSVSIGLGFGLELPDGFVAFNAPRSGCAKKGIISNVAAIDSGYRGEIHAIVTNTTNIPYFVEKGDRLCNLVIVPCILAEFCDNLGEERGIGAFNSTGK